ncbi:hypothetical protein Q8W71_11260 [Methylobacterium sp. NEAU 140]|uniref:hypothetical protein n=1 Tax=Methylobacterium sp. NEAU 140 TaxID=3064945 RepID=UPI002732C554|nr:hypothetical protein [Methylobacterium sp. NEAU 140]MDP4023205.1 hypothetical protein [Methylobacterium sp. NEAU 140]
MSKTEPKLAASPEDLLKAAVSRAGPKDAADAPATKASRRLPVPRLPRLDARLLGTAAAMLALGALLGAGATTLATQRDRGPGAAVAALNAGLKAQRGETARLGGEVAQLNKALTELRGSVEGARKDAAARGAALGDRLAGLDRTIAGKVTALGERIDQAEREQGARFAALAARAAAKTAEKAPEKAAEPTQTGSLADPRAADRAPEPRHEARAEPRADTKLAAVPAIEAKPKAAEKPPVLDDWAVRDVFDGAAIVENRRRRLFQVGPGDTLPGLGRVEAVERQGRAWVVVTRHGILTPQPW